MVTRIEAAHSAWIGSIAFDLGTAQILSGGHDHAVRIWDSQRGRLIREFQGHTGVIWDVLPTPDGTRVISRSSDRTVRIWDRESAKCMRVIAAETNCFCHMALTADGSRLITGNLDGAIGVW